MYGNLAFLIYFCCDKTLPISAQRIFVNCLFVVYFINTKKKCQDFGHILAKKLCLPYKHTQINDIKLVWPKLALCPENGIMLRHMYKILTQMTF